MSWLTLAYLSGSGGDGGTIIGGDLSIMVEQEEAEINITNQTMINIETASNVAIEVSDEVTLINSQEDVDLEAC